MRVDAAQPWKPIYLLQPFYNVVLALGFEYGIAIYDIELENVVAGRKPWPQARHELGQLWRKVRGQLIKDYVAFPLLSGLAAPTTIAANLVANLTRNVWSHAVIFCGHFPDGTHAFTEDQLAKLSPCIGDFISGKLSLFMATYYMYFPFLACEVKCGAAALDIANRQNAHSMTLALLSARMRLTRRSSPSPSRTTTSQYGSTVTTR